ncbi:UNVERIFIED_CONTAM: hypothetical protein RMT77_019009 [Armadillidium vulgare]
MGLYSKFRMDQSEKIKKHWKRYQKEDTGKFSLSHLQTAFYVLGCGLLISAFTFAAEILHSKRRGKHELLK